MVAQARAHRMPGIGSADRNSVAGVVRALTVLRKLLEDAAEDGIELPPFKLGVGARLVFDDGTPDIIAYPTTRHGWGRLTRMLTIGNRRTIKGDCVMKLENLLQIGRAPCRERVCQYVEISVVVVSVTTTKILS